MRFTTSSVGRKVLMAGSGFFMLLYVVPITSYRQLAVPDRLLGRVTAVTRVATWGTGATLGYALGGVIAEATSRPVALVVAAVLQTVVPIAIFGARRFRTLRSIEAAVALDARRASADR